jgi:hypothetical protein
VHKLTVVANANERYFFYDGTSQPESMVKSWDRVFKRVGETADPVVSNCHPHRFRDTFAVFRRRARCRFQSSHEGKKLLKRVQCDFLVRKCCERSARREARSLERIEDRCRRRHHSPRGGGLGSGGRLGVSAGNVCVCMAPLFSRAAVTNSDDSP